jgi:hypothetical protein
MALPPTQRRIFSQRGRRPCVFSFYSFSLQPSSCNLHLQGIPTSNIGTQSAINTSSAGSSTGMANLMLMQIWTEHTRAPRAKVVTCRL